MNQGWKYESHRHALAAKGVKTRQYAARIDDVERLSKLGVPYAEAVKASNMAKPPKFSVRVVSPDDRIRIRIVNPKDEYIRFKVPDLSDAKRAVHRNWEQAKADFDRDPNVANYRKFKKATAEHYAQFKEDLSNDRTVLRAKEMYGSFENELEEFPSPEDRMVRTSEGAQIFLQRGWQGVKDKYSQFQTERLEKDLLTNAQKQELILEDIEKQRAEFSGQGYDQFRKFQPKEDQVKALAQLEAEEQTLRAKVTGKADPYEDQRRPFAPARDATRAEQSVDRARSVRSLNVSALDPTGKKLQRALPRDLPRNDDPEQMRSTK